VIRRLAVLVVVANAWLWPPCTSVRAAFITTPVESTFDSDVDGWKIFGAGLGSGGSGGDEAVHAASFGNPGGYLQWTQTYFPQDQQEAIAPAKFLGDWSALIGHGAISFDYKVFHPGTMPGPGASVLSLEIIRQGSGTASVDFLDGPYFKWTHFEVLLDESLWHVQGIPGVTFADILANVTDVEILMEAIESHALPGEIVGLDNVRLVGAAAVPEPASFVLMAAGLTILAAGRRAFGRSWRGGCLLGFSLKTSLPAGWRDTRLSMRRWRI
jgi:hypothetical protein